MSVQFITPDELIVAYAVTSIYQAGGIEAVDNTWGEGTYTNEHITLFTEMINVFKGNHSSLSTQNATFDASLVSASYAVINSYNSGGNISDSDLAEAYARIDVYEELNRTGSSSLPRNTPNYPPSTDPSQFAPPTRVKYNSYSGADITASIISPDDEQSVLTLGELQTISYSIHRENTPVRGLGHSNVCGFVKGPRTIAGSLIFTQFDHYTFYRLKKFQSLVDSYMYPLGDMLPPFDILLSFSNEFGSFSKMKIFGVTIVDEGATMSIEDLVTEQTYTFMARGIQPITSYVPEGLQNLYDTPEEIKNYSSGNSEFFDFLKPSISFGSGS